MNYRIILLASGLLTLIGLFLPFVWMKIGPLGYQNYGPTVPDIYIYGGMITGKDTSFWGIAFAVVFQLVCILLFAVVSFTALFMQAKAQVLALLTIQSVLLALFPLWLNLYVSGVKNNSDGADLTIRYQFGMIVYGMLIVLNVLGFIQTVRSRRFNRVEDSF